ncbi:MAG: polymerase subunit delta, partial [Bacteroidota bacterium]
KLNEEETSLLEKYVENPVESTILVFAHKHKKVDSRKKVFKTLDKAKMLFHSEPVKDYNLAKWIDDEARNLQIKLAPGISQLLADYLGNDLSRIANELNKMKLVLKDGEVLDGKLVETHIGISKEFNVFELQKALGKKDANTAFKIAYYMGKNPKTNPIVMTIGNLYNFFSNVVLYHTVSHQSQPTIASELGINSYFVKDYAEAARLYPLKFATRIISVLREIDLKSKGLGAVNMDEGELLKEMVYKIINIDKVKK